MVCSSWFFIRSSMRIQAWPVHQTRPNLGVGLRRWIDGMKDVSSRAGSQDSQRLCDWIQDEPVEVLQARSMAEEEQLVESLLIKQLPDSLKPFPDQQSSQFPLAFRGRPFSRSRSQTDLMQFLLPFGVGLSPEADRRLASGSSACRSGRAFSGPPPGTRDWSIIRDCSSSLPMGC